MNRVQYRQTCLRCFPENARLTSCGFLEKSQATYNALRRTCIVPQRSQRFPSRRSALTPMVPGWVSGRERRSRGRPPAKWRGKGAVSPLQQSQFPGPGDRLVAGGSIELAVDRLDLGLDGVRGQVQLGGDLGGGQVRGQ
jgi:hypothetical protein